MEPHPTCNKGGDTDGQSKDRLPEGPRRPGGSRGGSGRELRDRQRCERLRLELFDHEQLRRAGRCRSTLTGDTASKVEAAARAKVPNGTIVRVETDADGNAAYEAHMTKADGTPVTVYVNEQFEVVSVETR